jgi:carbon storage regulator
VLVLARKSNESVMVNGNISIVVVSIRKNKVRLGIEAPKEIPIHRSEVHDAIQREQKR